MGAGGRVMASPSSGGREQPFDLAEPLAASLVESLRAFSYQLPTAIADLLDNSVTAGGTHVWIDFLWNGTSSTISVTDDGSGMDDSTLVEAMRPGSRNPLTPRDPSDLGRFGLGLKTASFSQCRRMTVRSRAAARPPATRCWDLDHIASVNAWQLLREGDEAAEAHFRRLEDLPSGTCVVWQKMDRLVDGYRIDSDRDQQNFLRHADSVRQHIGVVFHRLMTGAHAIRILLNGRAVAAWDPFLLNEAATQVLPSTGLQLRGSVIQVQPFVLPHHSKISKEKLDKAAGPRGWNAHQGFFVYRNNRLLVAGDWLGLGWPKEAQFRLARIQIDLPNSLDADWSIDVTKSRALPPAALREELRLIAERTRAAARLIYAHRGARLVPTTDAERVLLWEPAVLHGKTFYRLNREHPVLRQVLTASNDRATLLAFLRLLEETVPSAHFALRGAGELDAVPEPFEGASRTELSEILRSTYRAYLSLGFSHDEALGRLRTVWPFELYPDLLDELSESVA